jgi:hypothetical protein
MKKEGKENLKKKHMFSIVIIITLIISAITISIYFKNNKIQPSNCLKPSIISNFFYGNNITKNNGGWTISIFSECKITAKWSDTILEISNNKNILVIKIVGIDQQTANSVYNINEGSTKAQLLIYQTGTVYWNNNNSRVSISEVHIEGFNITDYKSFENTSVALMMPIINSNSKIKIGDTLFIFRDINADGIDEIPINSTINLQSKNGDFGVYSNPLNIN